MIRVLGLTAALVVVAALPAALPARADVAPSGTAARSVSFADPDDGTDDTGTSDGTEDPATDGTDDGTSVDSGTDEGTDPDDGLDGGSDDPTGGDHGYTPAPEPTPGPATVSFSDVWIDGNGAGRRVLVGNGSTVPITFFVSVSSSARVDPQPRLALQRRIGPGAWKTLDVRVPNASATTGAVIVRTPAWSTTAARTDVAYRLRSSAWADGRGGGVRTTTTSPAFTVSYDDQSRYTGVARTIWRTVRPYCPTTAVRITTLQAGRAGEYRTGGLALLIDRGVGTAFNTTLTSQQALGLHECAHQRQWLNYGSTYAGYRTMLRAASKTFTNDAKPQAVRVPYRYTRATAFSPIEHAADCSAQALHPGGYLGYGGYCNAKELAAGRRLLLGKRY